jgi:periplasmic protein TonB
MFDAVLSNRAPPRKYLAGFGLSLVVYAAGIGAAFLLLSRAEQTEEITAAPAVTLFTALPPPPPPPPAPAGASKPATEAPKTPRKPKIVEQKVLEPTPVQTPVEPEPVEEEASAPSAEQPSDVAAEGGVPGGVAGGVAGGVVGGVVGGVLGGTGTKALPFGPGMTRPQQISGTPPVYTREALAARVEGKVLVRCVLSVRGEVQDCQVIKGLPMLTDVVLASLRASRFTPVNYRGVPTPIQYLFTFNFKLP